LLVIVSAHSLVSLAFLLSDEPLSIKVAADRGFFNKLLVPPICRPAHCYQVRWFLI
jgi:hypothetical protein